MSTPDVMTGPLRRVFPWHPGAPVGSRFSPSFIPEPTGRGRFDLPRRLSPVLYAAETADHAAGEMLQPWRGQPLEPYHLIRAGLPLAIVEVEVPFPSASNWADLCDASFLHHAEMALDATASRHRHITQPLARAAWDAGYHGLRWWSSFWGDWHTVVLFTARIRGGLRFGVPEVLTIDHPAVTEAAALLGMLRR